jgi:hypothetical protein
VGHRNVSSSSCGFYHKFDRCSYRNEESPKSTFKIASSG